VEFFFRNVPHGALAPLDHRLRPAACGRAPG
jgi:hypothetical protein